MLSIEKSVFEQILDFVLNSNRNINTVFDASF